MSAGPAVEILLFIITGDSLCCGNERERIGVGVEMLKRTRCDNHGSSAPDNIYKSCNA